MTAEPEYRSREFDSDAHDRYVEMLLQRLAEAAARTDPAKGPQSAQGKDRAAFQALRTAGELVDAVAGWAIDHVCGLSVAGESALPPQPLNTRAQSEYQRSREIADQHSHERDGGKIYEDRGSLTDERAQMLLRNLLFSGLTAAPDWLRVESYRALDALALGETVPLLDKSKKHAGAKVRYNELRAQLNLIAIMRFRAEAYGGVEAAREFVAEKLGAHRPDAFFFEVLRTWEKRLPGRLGDIEVDRAIEFATNAGAYVKHAIDQTNKGLKLTNDEKKDREIHEGRYGPGALDAAVKAYLELAKKAPRARKSAEKIRRIKKSA